MTKAPVGIARAGSPAAALLPPVRKPFKPSATDLMLLDTVGAGVEPEALLLLLLADDDVVVALIGMVLTAIKVSAMDSKDPSVKG